MVVQLLLRHGAQIDQKVMMMIIMVIRIVDKNDDDVDNDYGDSNDAADTWCSY